MTNLEARTAIRLVGGLADGFVFTVPINKVPSFVTVGPRAHYRRAPGDGEVVIYRFVESDES